MLLELIIENFALIEKLRINFSNGFNVLTGETGAGKSIIIDAVGLLLGGRASSESIRSGEERALVEGLFSIEGLPEVRMKMDEYGIDSDEETLIMTREISHSDKNRCRINGRPVTLGVYQEFGDLLIDIHGQHQHQSLLKVSKHRELLDAYGGQEMERKLKESERLYKELFDVRRSLEELERMVKEDARNIDLLSYQIDEITGANLLPGEPEELERERRMLANAERLYNLASTAYSRIYEGNDGELSALDNLTESLKGLEELARIDETLAEKAEALKGAIFQIEDVAFGIRKYRDMIDMDSSRLEQVEERIQIINQLKRKYGDSVEEILKYCEDAKKRLALIVNRDDERERLKREESRLEEEFGRVCKDLSNSRRRIAEKFKEEIERELVGLSMPSARFDVVIRQTETDDDKGIAIDGVRYKAHSHGIDEVEFIFSANKGEELKPLAKIASGGEISRVMLVLKRVLAGADNIPTMIFDEIDTGISGEAALAVARKMTEISRARQVICVTHMAQIAAVSDRHFYIYKEVTSDRTRTVVKQLDEHGRVDEIARLLGGNIKSPITIEHARELLRDSDRLKENVV